MTSCAFPSSVTTSRLWSFERDQDLTSDECGWPKEFTGNRIVKRSRTLSDEDAGKKLLDFDQLEKDIIKHVLADDDNSHSEAVDVFPSFNYAPFPFPKNFLKSNPILKLYPRDPGTFVGSVETKTEKFLQPTQILPKISLRTQVSNHSAPPSYFTPLPKIPEAQRTHDRLTSSVSTVGIEQLLKITGQKHEVQRSANMRMVSLTPTPYRGNMFASMTHQSPYATMPIMTAKEGRPDEKVSIPLVETLPLTQATPTPECLPIRKTWRMEGQVTRLHQSDRQLASPKVKNTDIHRWNEMQATTAEKPALVKIPTIYSETTKTFAQIVANTLRMNEGHPLPLGT